MHKDKTSIKTIKLIRLTIHDYIFTCTNKVVRYKYISIHIVIKIVNYYIKKVYKSLITYSKKIFGDVIFNR